MAEASATRPKMEILLVFIIFIVFLCSLAATIVIVRFDSPLVVDNIVRVKDYREWAHDGWIVIAYATVMRGVIMSPLGIGFGVYVFIRRRSCGPFLMSFLLVFFYFVSDNINRMRDYYDRVDYINRIEDLEDLTGSVISRYGVEKTINGERIVYYGDIRYGFGIFGVDGNEISWYVFSPDYSKDIIKKSNAKYFPEIQKIVDYVDYLNDNSDSIAWEMSKKNQTSQQLALVNIRYGVVAIMGNMLKN